jgi:hypothetical protein
MTERDWLEATDPEPILGWLRHSGKLTERKARLFAVACCRRIWHLLTDESSRELLKAVERWADGETGFRPVAAAYDRHETASYEFPSLWFAVCSASGLTPDSALKAAREAAEGTGCSATAAFTDDDAVSVLSAVASRAERRAQAELARDLFGNPFCPMPPLLASAAGAVVKLARAAYDERLLPEGHLDPARLAVLADALEEGGAPTEVLAHLRSPGPHVRGCHAVDAILGRG